MPLFLEHRLVKINVPSDGDPHTLHLDFKLVGDMLFEVDCADLRGEQESFWIIRRNLAFGTYEIVEREVALDGNRKDQAVELECYLPIVLIA